MALKLNLNGLQSLKKRLKALEKRDVKTGFFDSYYDDGTSVAQVAAWSNYGTSFHPERPFMNDTFMAHMNRQRIHKAIRDVFRSVANSNGQAFNALNRLGKEVAEIMKQTIDDYPGHNSPNTIAIKGFDDPLYDTGKMLRSVTFKIDSSKQLA
ncbi:hypothetical protein I6U33_06535 [Pseudomonas carnis]|uniref:hypothetical protein n=1 Tax=Pseudomonas TaxID=286 RepID=UPI0018E76C2B|nr:MULTISPECIES: hypothetical protein [Pseudomonas]MBJ2227247.1 hypothetical protein [Pseudomonas sp. MF7451]MBW9236982.1 hypothetical protein [Pseudomonas carnis]